MLRRYHRWLATVAAIFVLWTATTGIVAQSARMVASSGEQSARAAAPLAAPPPAAAPSPPQSPARKFAHFVTELHSGEEFGLTGQLVSLVTGLAVLFFAVSGLTMYIQMARGRLVKARDGKPLRGGKWFWQ